jgi:hypothetical protein
MEAMITFGTPLLAVGAIIATIILVGEHLDRKGVFQQWGGLKTA